MKHEEKIHGSMFLLLKKFIESNYDSNTWIKLNQAAETNHRTYERQANYPASELHALISQATHLTGLTEDQLKEKFGEYLVPDLITIYGSYINPSWKTYEMLAYTEHVMHKAVRKEDSTANPPILSVSRVHNKLIIIDYRSERKLASLAIGIIKGIAAHYHESDKVHIVPVSNVNDSRVQIRVEFD